MSSLDIVIPVYNEGRNILPVMEALKASVRTPFRVLVCYDREDDDTLAALRGAPAGALPEWLPVRNEGAGAHGAVVTGFRRSSAEAVLMLPADDTFNAPILDAMVARFREGSDVVCASRFMPGGEMTGCPWLKAVLVRTASFTLRHLAGLPVHDATNGFRLFSRRLLDAVPVESSRGFSYSLELLVKAHRRGLRIAEVPAVWRERTQGTSRFRILKWLPDYLRWYAYAFATRLGARA